MTEFEELTLKKITKEFMMDNVYSRFNKVMGVYGISNSEISKQIGWDPAGFNQKYSRNNDLRLTTFVKIYVALIDLISEKEAELGLGNPDTVTVGLGEFLTHNELEIGRLYNHISAAAENKSEFLSEEKYVAIYKRMKPFVIVGKKNKKFSDQEINVYTDHYKTLL